MTITRSAYKAVQLITYHRTLVYLKMAIFPTGGCLMIKDEHVELSTCTICTPPKILQITSRLALNPHLFVFDSNFSALPFDISGR